MTLNQMLEKDVIKSGLMMMFYGHFCEHGRLNGPSHLQR